jgi:hypothetical protein
MHTFMSMYALELLLTANTWDKKRQVLEDQQEFLLTKDAIDALTALIERRRITSLAPESERDEWVSQKAYLITYRGLLIQARSKGIREAWAEFRMMMAAFQL